MPTLTPEERLARALGESTEEVKETLTPEERLAKALGETNETKKKSQSQSGSSTEESSSGTSATKKEQSSGTTKPLSLEEKKELARKQKLGQLDEKKQESKIALERKQKSTNINWDVDKETEQAFKGVATKEEKMAQAKQEAMSVGETFVPNIEEKSRAKEIQEAKPEQDLKRRLNLIPKEDLKSIFEGDNELTMFDGGQRLAEKYKLTDEEVDKAKAKYLEETVNEFKRKDLESSLDLIGKYAPAPKDFKDATAYTQNIELLNKAKEMNFEKNKNLSFSLMGLEDNDRKVIDEYSSVMDRLNAYKGKSFMQQQQGADETGKGSMVINPKEIAQFEKDLKESQRLSKEVDKIRGNNNKLFDQYANVINKETGKTVTQESFTSKYENDYMKLKGALTDATYKLNYVEKEARRIRDTSREKGIVLTAKQNETLSNLDRERNLAKAEVLALSNALFLNEDITKKVARYEKADSYYQMPGKKAERLFEVLGDLKQGFSETVLGEFNMTSTSEKNQARILNEKLKSVGINLKDIDKEIAPTYPEKFGNVLGTSAVLGANIAATTFLTGGVGTLARGAGVLPKVFELYDKSKKFKAIADVIISGVNFELASDQTSFAMGSAEEAAQLVFKKVTGKLKPLNPILEFFTKSLVGATGVTVEEYAGDLFHEFTKTGISQETFDKTFGKTKEEGLEKWSLTFTMGMMSMGKHAKILMVGSYETAKAINPNAETVKQMESVMSEMGVDPDDVVAQLKAEAQTKSDRLYPDGKGGQLSASNMTVEQEIVLRDKLKYKPLTEDELAIKRSVQETEELAPADSPYVTKKEMDDDLNVLKGEDEGTLPETYVGESVRTEEGIVTTVTEKVEEGTQLRVPTEQLITEEAKPVSETFDREKAGVIDVWQDTETNELFVINGTKRVATAMEDGVASVDVNFVKANDLQEAYKIGDLKNKLEDTDKTLDAVELVKANPVLKDNLDLSKPKELELFGLASLNESLTEELKTDPKQAEVLSIIGNSVPTESQSEVYQFAKDNNFGKDEVAQLVKEPNLKEEGLADKVKIKTEQAKTGQSNIDALSKDATQLGVEPETLYDRVLSNSPTVKALTEKYAKGVADGLYSTTEATNRLNAEIKENLGKITEEAGLGEAKKDVAQLEEALTPGVKQEVKQGVNEIFESNSELANIGTKEQYSEYIDSIFPNSQVKDIVYHGSNAEFDKFDKSKLGTNATLGNLSKKGFFFTNNKRVSDFYGKTKPYLINLKNPAKLRDEYGNVIGAAIGDIEEAIKKTSNADGVIAENFKDSVVKDEISERTGEYVIKQDQYIVFEPEQIHILGDKKDIKGFKEFVDNQKSKKSSSDILRDIASKVDKLADKIGNNTYSTVLGVEPLIGKIFLKGLSVTLKTSATFIEAFNKAIKKLQANAEFKKKTAQEQADIIAQLTNSITDIKQKADLKNPITKLQQSKVKQSVRDRIKHLYQTQMTSLPTLKSIEKIAANYGIIDAKTFAEKLYRDLNKLEKTRERRMETFEGAISDFITKGGGNIKSLFNKLSDLILKDKQQAVTLKNVILSALEKANTKGLNFNQQHLAQITTAFEKANLTNLSGIYDLTSKIDQIVNKAVDITLNNKINDLQSSVSRYAKAIKNVKQKEYIKALTELTASQILDEKLKSTLIDTLENVKDYLSNKANLDYDEKTSQDNLKQWQSKIEEYKKNKEEALIEKSHENYLANNPGVSISLEDYKDLILPLENEIKYEEKLKKLEENKEAKRKALEDLTKNNIESILDYFRKDKKNKNSLRYEKIKDISALKIQTITDFLNVLDFYVDNNLLSSLSIKQLAEINRVYAEIEHFQSYSKLGTLNAQLNGVKRAIENQANIIGRLRDFSNKIKRVLFAPNKNLFVNRDLALKGLHRFIERVFVGQEANTISSIIFGSLDNGKNIAITKSNEFATKLNKLADFELNRKENFDLGLKTFLLSSPVDASEMDAQLLFERKKEKVAMDIEKLNKVANDNNQNEATRKQARIRAKLYQNSLDNINQYDSYADYVDAYENGTLLTKSQKLVDDFIKSEYSIQQPQLKDSNELFNDKEFEELKYYSSISYLNSPDVEVQSIEELNRFSNQRGIDDATSGTTSKRVKDPRTVRDIIDFDYYNVSKRRVLENYLDIHTKGSRIQIEAFLESEAFKEVFKGDTALLNEFKARIVEYLNSNLAKKKPNLKQTNITLKYVAKILKNFKLHVLARPGQVVKQLTILAHALSRLDVDLVKATGIYLANRFSSNGQEKIKYLMSGSDSANRKAIGDEQFSQEVAKLSERNLTATEVYKFLDKHVGSRFGLSVEKLFGKFTNQQSASKIGDIARKLTIDLSVKYPTKIAGGAKAATIDSGIHLMTYPDLLINKLTFMAAMIREQRKQVKKGVTNKEKLGVFTSINTLISNKDTENTYKADRVAGFINNESDPTKQGGMFTKQNAWNMLFYQFRSMAVNASIGAQNAMLDLFDKNATIKDREIALRNLVGWTSSIVTFQAVSLLLYQLTEKMVTEPVREALGAEEDKEKAKKNLNFIDNIGEEEFLKQFAFKVMMKAGIDAISGGIIPQVGLGDEFGKELEPKVKKFVSLTTDVDINSESVFYGGFGKYSGVIDNAKGIWDAFTDIPSPYVKNAEKLRKQDVVDIIEAQFDALQERPEETLVDIAYQLSMVAGKGTPSQVFGIMKKVLKENYNVKSGSYERLNPAQNPKEDK